MSKPTEPSIGIFGGAFDPPHWGHVWMAEQAIHNLQLDCLWVIPTGYGVHKSRQLTAAKDRLAMSQLAFEPIERALVSSIEIQKFAQTQQVTYTYDTLLQIQAHYQASGQRAQLNLIVGEDQARSLPTWYKAQDLSQLAKVRYVPRDVPREVANKSSDGSFDTFDLTVEALLAQNLPHLNIAPLLLNILPSMEKTAQVKENVTHAGQPTPYWQMSSSFVRANIANATSRQASTWCPPAVVQYIQNHQLYCA